MLTRERMRTYGNMPIQGLMRTYVNLQTRELMRTYETLTQENMEAFHV
jgi:hypothetical protein